MAKRTDSTDSKILARIRRRGRGWVFTPADFSDLGARDAIASALKRHKAAGLIRHLARGLYDFPRPDPVFGQLSPSTEAIVTAIARRGRYQLQPAGAQAASALGLSNQVPSRAVYLTNGPSRIVALGKRLIRLRHVTARQLIGAGSVSGAVIQALRHLGRSRVDDRVIAVLDRKLSATQRAVLRQSLRRAPRWIGDALRPILSPAA